jgi:hypothetical protein
MFSTKYIVLFLGRRALIHLIKTMTRICKDNRLQRVPGQFVSYTPIAQIRQQERSSFSTVGIHSFFTHMLFY